MGRNSMKQPAWVALVAAALCLPGCGTLIRDTLVHSYMGIPFDVSETPPEIAELAQRSLAGDKQAQLDLGIAFEEGRGLAVDLDKARKLYQLAASDSGGPMVVYVPGFRGDSGLMTRVGVGADRRGLVEAQARLDLMGKGKLMSSNNADQTMSGQSEEVELLCRLITSASSQSPIKQQEFVPEVLREFQNGNPSITRLQWSREAIGKVFPDSPVSNNDSLSYQAFLISSGGGCDVSEELEAAILLEFRVSDVGRTLPSNDGIGQGDIFDVIPLKRSGDRYSVIINFKKGSRTVVDAFALIWE